MKVHYYPKTGSLYIELTPSPGADAREIADGVVLDIDADGNPVGIDSDRASRRLDPTGLETVALPVVATQPA